MSNELLSTFVAIGEDLMDRRSRSRNQHLSALAMDLFEWASDIAYDMHGLCFCPECRRLYVPMTIDWDDDPPAWALGQDPYRCEWCGQLVV